MRSQRILALAAAILFLLAAIACAQDGRTASVSANSLNLRGGPGTQETVLRSLIRGTLVTVLEEQGDWSRVRLEDGTIGWASSKYLAPVTALPQTSAPAPRVQAEATPSPSAKAQARSAGGGGLSLGSIAKWGCLAGGVVLGALAYTERSSGDDAYDEYKELFDDGDYDAADLEYDDAADHDDQAQLYTIAGGVLIGLFVLQQFVLGGDGDDDAASLGPASLGPGLDPAPAGCGWRLALVRLRL